MDESKVRTSSTVNEIVMAGASLLAAGATIYLVWRTFAGPDAERTISMWAWDKIRTEAVKRELHWNKVAKAAGDNYWALSKV